MYEVTPEKLGLSRKQFQELEGFMDNVLYDMRDYYEVENQRDLRTLKHAIMEAILSGDFLKYVCQLPELETIAQVAYTPFAGVTRLKQENKLLKSDIEKLKSLLTIEQMEEFDCYGGE